MTEEMVADASQFDSGAKNNDGLASVLPALARKRLAAKKKKSDELAWKLQHFQPPPALEWAPPLQLLADLDESDFVCQGEPKSGSMKNVLRIHDLCQLQKHAKENFSGTEENVVDKSLIPRKFSKRRRDGVSAVQILPAAAAPMGPWDVPDDADYSTVAWEALNHQAEAAGWDPFGDENIVSDAAVTVIVARLKSTTTEQMIEDAMRRFGPVNFCRLVRHHETGASKKYAFVSFAQHSQAALAVSKASATNPEGGFVIDGKRVLIDFERGRAQGNAPPPLDQFPAALPALSNDEAQRSTKAQRRLKGIAQRQQRVHSAPVVDPRTGAFVPRRFRPRHNPYVSQLSLVFLRKPAQSE